MPDHDELSALLFDISALRRPRLLIRAARMGQMDYSRNRDLRRLIGAGDLSRPATVLSALLEEELRLDTARREGAAEYNVTRHVAVMIALMAEARLYAFAA